ncbi:ATP-binding protein [Paenibacillus sp. MWE-103]|uniref:ATP-binding protein n=1 Tax=Paenibacillus artemisiicola TaxID=1172618 RepID=A0ABS3W5K1_9BACL|nr:ATP-binding protein [Paenibacillus artemisiicola]MBO7743566.1 ATP-binding protein [Paenibacillus artemisiicola]
MDRVLQPSEQTSLAEAPYADNEAYLQDELTRLDYMIHIHRLRSGSASALLADPSAGHVGSEDAQRQAFNVLEARMLRRTMLSKHAGVHLALPRLALLFRLSEIERLVLMIALAPELDLNYAKQYADMQHDAARTMPSVELAMQLLQTRRPGRMLAQAILDPSANLVKFRLLRLHASDSSPYLGSRGLCADSQIANYIIGMEQLDGRLGTAAYFAEGLPDPDIAWLHEDLLGRMQKLIRSQLDPSGALNRKLMFVFSGETGSWKRRSAEAVCRELGISLLIGDIAKMLDHPMTFAECLFLLCREAHLHPAALCLLHSDSLFAHPDRHSKEIAAFLDAMELFPNLIFVLGTRAWPALKACGNEGLIDVAFELPGPELRRELWNRLAAPVPMEERVDLAAVADKFRFTPGRIQNAMTMARNLAIWRDPVQARVSMKDLQASCCAQPEHALDRLADPLTPVGTLRDLILPPDQIKRLQEIIDQVKYRSVVHGEWGFRKKLSRGVGLNILLHGPPGTGKTMAAEVIANELELDLYRINLAQVVSKYIGETEKNLHAVFQGAEDSRAMLFFDEADALFGKRTEAKDALDRHANTEIAFLLQQMEEYDGITILATNLLHNMDAAFIRRMQYSIEFPIPDDSQRREIWKAMFPDEAPRHESIDYGFLARQFHISGGHIKNVVLSAAFLAAKEGRPIGMEHLIPSVKREMDKTGKLTSKEDFGAYYALLGGSGP